jgi:hypothetical protein
MADTLYQFSADRWQQALSDGSPSVVQSDSPQTSVQIERSDQRQTQLLYQCSELLWTECRVVGAPTWRARPRVRLSLG